ncbi:MAG TPA: polyhydroxyalkanoate synthesis regulator DNA-binding domain-containing protein [Balneolales bacterium]|nr:polyhydroxyalkanoate synthesis regulator DNA-binding domain-containing protein [Balneolales bacterium]
MKRIIKRYQNRKLYDSEAGNYVALADIAKLIRNGNTVKVIDNENGKDITSLTLTHIILEEGKKGVNPLSSDTLHEVIRMGGKFLDDSLLEVKKRINDIIPSGFNTLITGKRNQEIELLKNRIEKLEDMIDDLTKESRLTEKKTLS